MKVKFYVTVSNFDSGKQKKLETNEHKSRICIILIVIVVRF